MIKINFEFINELNRFYFSLLYDFPSFFPFFKYFTARREINIAFVLNSIIVFLS